MAETSETWRVRRDAYPGTLEEFDTHLVRGMPEVWLATLAVRVMLGDCSTATVARAMLEACSEARHVLAKQGECICRPSLFGTPVAMGPRLAERSSRKLLSESLR